MGWDNNWGINAIKRLVRVPSRGGVDNPKSVVDESVSLAQELRLPYEIVSEGEKPLGVWVRSGNFPSPQRQRVALFACIDTSGFDEYLWETKPTDPFVESGWMHGRGSADSKAMAVVFLKVAEEFRQKKIPVEVFLDADEHTGHFRGTRTFVKACKGLTGGYIGYPGSDAINRGARGFYRVRIRCEGKEGHTGSIERPNAITIAAKLIPAFTNEYFERVPTWEGKKPQWTVTGIRGGGDWGRNPEHCDLEVDIRLTKVWDKKEAQTTLEDIFKRLELKQQVVCEEVVGASPYAISAENPLVKILFEEALKANLVQRGSKVCGPSNVGNFLAELGVPVVCGFGPRYKNIHAPNEMVCLEDLPSIYEIYSRALERLIMLP